MKPSVWSLLTRIRHGLGERFISSESSTLEIRPFFCSSHKILMSILSSFIAMPSAGGDKGVKALRLQRHTRVIASTSILSHRAAETAFLELADLAPGAHFEPL